MTLQVLESPHTAALEVRPIGGRSGAEIHGVRLAPKLPPTTVDAIRHALLKHKVIFFRGQNHLDEAEQEAFGRLFGALVPHPTVPSLRGTDNVLDIDGSRGERASSWHTDVTFVADYPKISILRGVVVPEAGGDTLWANSAAAYADLAEGLRDFAEKLWLLHSNVYDYVGNRQVVSEEGQRRYNEVFTSTRYETEHPLVHVHPETGEHALILGHFAQKVIGYGSTDSAHRLRPFQDPLTPAENPVRRR